MQRPSLAPPLPRTLKQARLYEPATPPLTPVLRVARGAAAYFNRSRISSVVTTSSAKNP